mgnify:CR=1 FL=1
MILFWIITAGAEAHHAQNETPIVLDYLQPYVSMYKVDLKTFQDRQYRKLGGRLRPVLDTIQSLVSRGIWTEVVTLTIPGYNDSDEELTDIARFITSLSSRKPSKMPMALLPPPMHAKAMSGRELLFMARICSRASSPMTRWKSATSDGNGCGPQTVPSK